jgi:hypothetical protein
MLGVRGHPSRLAEFSIGPAEAGPVGSHLEMRIGDQLPASPCTSGMNRSRQSAGTFFTVPTLFMNST